jgi:hypothetical protein
VWYLLSVVLISAVGIAAVLVRHRPRNSMDSSIRDFTKNLGALAPTEGAPRGSRPRRPRTGA